MIAESTICIFPLSKDFSTQFEKQLLHGGSTPSASGMKILGFLAPLTEQTSQYRPSLGESTIFSLLIEPT